MHPLDCRNGKVDTKQTIYSKPLLDFHFSFVYFIPPFPHFIPYVCMPAGVSPTSHHMALPTAIIHLIQKHKCIKNIIALFLCFRRFPAVFLSPLPAYNLIKTKTEDRRYFKRPKIASPTLEISR